MILNGKQSELEKAAHSVWGYLFRIEDIMVLVFEYTFDTKQWVTAHPENETEVSM